VKKRISATVEKETLEIIKEILKKRKYRNKSHVIEEAINVLWEKEK
jgi:Arc/MetJ-type ribon-helix-helix transcriptional regulator